LRHLRRIGAGLDPAIHPFALSFVEQSRMIRKNLPLGFDPMGDTANRALGRRGDRRK
jgi:hypothetical protein